MRIAKRLMAAALAVTLATSATLVAAGEVPGDVQETTQKVRKALAKLPYYGVFDFLAFSIDGGVIELKGFAHRPALKREAEAMIREAVKGEVANKIEILPSSSFDDQIRWSTFQRVYTGDIASKYVPGGEMAVRYEILDMARFPGMEPYGTYPVHIVVKNRKVLLVGLLDNDFDKTQVLLRARQVPHTLGIEDAVSVRHP